MSRPSEWVRVTLTIPQYAHAMAVGRARHAADAAAGLTDRKVLDDGVTAHVTGAVGEAAWSLHMGVHWDREFIDPRTQRLDGSDGGPTWDVVGYQIRSTCHPGGRLLIRPDDPDGDPFVLAYVQVPAVVFPGWLYGWEAKCVPPERISRRPGAMLLHAVPYQMLRPVASLIPRTALEWVTLPSYVPPVARTARAHLETPYFHDGRKQGG